ncbi:MAG: hypothetical protein AB8B83_07135 [Bdellovibrionales bacterium]
MTDKTQDEATGVFSAVDSVSEQLKAIETFVARRFDEISMEINATSQQMDMAEDGITDRFKEILQIMKAVSFSGDGSTPANTGVELDAIVKATEDAANSILDAADRMGDYINGDVAKVADADLVAKLNLELQNIYTSCSFQDITGQRVQKTLENLRSIEDRLGDALGQIGVDVDVKAPQSSPVEIAQSASQDDVDALFDD